MVTPRSGGRGGTTIVNYPGGAAATIGKLDAQAEAAQAAAANNRARAESGLYDAQALRALEEIEQLKLKGPQFAAEDAEKQRQFDVSQRSTDAGRAQQQAQFEANLRDNAARRAQEKEQFETESGGYDPSGAPTLKREDMVARHERDNLVALANRAEQAARIALARGDQITAKEQFALKHKLDQQRFGLEEKLGLGNLDVSKGRLGLDRERQAWEQAKDPFSATQKAYQLRGGTEPDRGLESAGQYEDLPEEEAPMPWERSTMPPKGGAWTRRQDGSWEPQENIPNFVTERGEAPMIGGQRPAPANTSFASGGYLADREAAVSSGRGAEFDAWEAKGIAEGRLQRPSGQP